MGATKERISTEVACVYVHIFFFQSSYVKYYYSETLLRKFWKFEENPTS
jgi:hypothetical protein